MSASMLYLTAVDPVGSLHPLVDTARTRSRYAAGPLVVFIVAAAILLGLAMTLAAGAAIYCIHEGGSMEWFATNGWKVWEVKVACRMP